MSRPISWLPRLHEIARTVSNSVRSHYDRHDLEQLFQLQPRAAQNLLQLLPVVQVGTSRLVERETLASFLDRVRDADDTTQLLEEIRKEKARISKRVIRTLVRRDYDPLPLTSLPSSIRLRPGRLEVNFESVLDLAESLYAFARVLETPEFAQTYVPPPAKPQEPAEFDELPTRRFGRNKREPSA